MITPAQSRADYRASMQRVGWTVKLRRMRASPLAPLEHDVMARIVDYEPHEIVNGMKLGSRKAIVLAEDIEASGIPLPLSKSGTDKLVDGVRVYNIDEVDDTSRRLQDVVVAYELRVSGA